MDSRLQMDPRAPHLPAESQNRVWNAKALGSQTVICLPICSVSLLGFRFFQFWPSAAVWAKLKLVLTCGFTCRTAGLGEEEGGVSCQGNSCLGCWLDLGCRALRSSKRNAQPRQACAALGSHPTSCSWQLTSHTGLRGPKQHACTPVHVGRALCPGPDSRGF